MGSILRWEELTAVNALQRILFYRVNCPFTGQELMIFVIKLKVKSMQFFKKKKTADSVGFSYWLHISQTVTPDLQSGRFSDLAFELQVEIDF